MSVGAAPAYAGLRGVRGALVYNETAFHHFLAVDVARARRQRRCLFLVLVAVGERQYPGRSSMLTDTATSAIFRGLYVSAREVDFLGWFRESRVAAAVLVQGPQTPGPAASRHVAERTRRCLEARLPIALAARLRVRVCRLGAPRND